MTTETVAGEDRGILCKLHLQKISTRINLPALSEVFARLKSPSILGGNSAKKDADRFSYWAAEPTEVFEFRAGQTDPFGKLHQALAKYELQQDPRLKTQDPRADLPKGIFLGGWVGYFSYELGRYIERLPETTTDDIRMPFVEKPRAKLAGLEQLLAESQKISIPPPLPADLDNIDFSQVQCNIDKDYYLKAVEKIKRYIYDGDVYQINFSQRFECDYNARPIELFHWQNYYNPSPYAAYIDGGDFHIVSASPEMFITIADGVISTKPIKGTRPRVSDTGQGKQINAKNFDELVDSEKEQAELNMIIDLERNDVARICRPGTRKVVQPRTIENYPTVFHAVATVAGELQEGVCLCDCLKAMFPGGSITGAPKIRSMEIIDETEPTERGVYTGSIGFIGVDGSVCLNIAIRTIIISSEKAYAQTGGGIVADSNPQAEWEETITKARALLAGIRVVQDSK